MNFFEAYFATEQQRRVIEYKLGQGMPLSIEEVYFMCENLTLDSCGETAECVDVYYNKIFIAIKSPDPLLTFTDTDQQNFDRLINEWGHCVSSPQIAGTLLHASAKETKNEIKHLQKEGLSENDYNERYLNLIAWSRFRYVMVKRIFDLEIKGDKYLMYLNGLEIRYDYESCEHIVARHFGHGMKEYSTIKDHFYDVFLPAQLHFDLHSIISAIDNSGFYHHDSILNINIKYLGITYRIYTKKMLQSVKGKAAPNEYYRLSTFFPLSPNSEAELINGYEEKNITQELSVFIKNP